MSEQDPAHPDATRYTDVPPPADADATHFGAAPPADPDENRFGAAPPGTSPTPTPAVSPTARDRRLPRPFAGYVLLEEIARGGMGVVYKAHQLGPDGKPLRLVALKMVLGGTEATPEVTQRFWNEARAAAGLNHPGIVPVVEAGDHDSMAFSPDGKRIVSASYDDTVKVWNAQTGQETLTLEGRTESVNSVAFSSDGQRLTSASGDRTVKVWDAHIPE